MFQIRNVRTHAPDHSKNSTTVETTARNSVHVMEGCATETAGRIASARTDTIDQATTNPASLKRNAQNFQYARVLMKRSEIVEADATMIAQESFTNVPMIVKSVATANLASSDLQGMVNVFLWTSVLVSARRQMRSLQNVEVLAVKLVSIPMPCVPTNVTWVATARLGTLASTANAYHRPNAQAYAVIPTSSTMNVETVVENSVTVSIAQRFVK